MLWASVFYYPGSRGLNVERERERERERDRQRDRERQRQRQRRRRRRRRRQTETGRERKNPKRREGPLASAVENFISMSLLGLDFELVSDWLLNWYLSLIGLLNSYSGATVYIWYNDDSYWLSICMHGSEVDNMEIRFWTAEARGPSLRIFPFAVSLCLCFYLSISVSVSVSVSFVSLSLCLSVYLSISLSLSPR